MLYIYSIVIRIRNMKPLIIINLDVHTYSFRHVRKLPHQVQVGARAGLLANR